MKPSGIEWIGDIPDDWEVIRFKNILKVRDDLSTNGDELLLSVSQYTGVTPRSEKIEDGDFISRADSLVGYRICNRNDLVMNIMLAWNGSLAFSNYDGIVSPAYAVFFIYNNNFYYKFLHYLLRTSAYTSYFRANSTGIIDSRLRLYPDVFGQLNCIYPPLETQQKIADYLDEKCGEIDKTIEKQKESIEKLKAYKQSLISETVTKGLNKSTPLKPTGIDFLGDIPSHWEVRRLKTLTSIISKGTTPTTIGRNIVDEGNIRFIKAENIQNDRLVIDPLSTIDNETNELLKRSQLKKNDILFVIAGATIGKVAIVDEEFLPANTNQAVSFIRLYATENHKYVYYSLKSNYVKENLNILAVQSAQPNLSMEDLGNFYLGYPNLSEQEEIVSYLNEKCDEIDSTINKKQKIIEKLDAYKKSLIFECVTGKQRI